MIQVRDLKTQSYLETLELQVDLNAGMKQVKKHGGINDREFLLLVEHPHVYTLGKHADELNLLVPESILAADGIEVHHITRGGDITYHGPGQLVAYPIIDLEKHHLGVKVYVSLLEQAVIDTIAGFGIEGIRDDGATGVWLNDEKGLRKICAIGVSISRSVTMHGLALNVNTDLSYFHRINPCGFTDRGVTSIARELGNEVDMDNVKKIFTEKFTSLLK